MVGKIVFFVCCLMCANPFFIISCNQSSINPIPFWSGSESELKKELKDIKAYNKQMGKLYKKLAAAFMLCGVAGMIYAILGFVMLGLVCTVGFYYVFKQYKKIKKKFM